MNLASETKGNVLIIKLNEEKIDIGNSIEFRNELSRHAKQSADSIVLDMSEVGFIDSSGIGVLITFYHFCVDANKTLKLASCRQKIVDTMKTTRLDKKIPMFESVDTALAS